MTIINPTVSTTLSDNLTQSQINMYKYYIDQGFTVDQILDMYIEPVLRD